MSDETYPALPETPPEPVADLVEVAEPTPEPVPPAEAPLRVDNSTRRSGDHPLEGHFCDVVDGPHAGRRGAFEKVEEFEADAYPLTILIRTRDEKNELLTVNYADVRPSGDYRGGR